MGLINSEDCKELLYVKCMGQDKAFISAMEEVIDNCPQVDAVQVVRCWDCKHHENEEIGMVYCPNMTGGWVDENWYCADGERIDENG